MADPLQFSRRFKELIAGENQMEVARKLGYTQSRISQIVRGEKPSRAFVERLIEAYDLEREEWLGLAGYGRGPAVEDERRVIAEEAARRALELAGVPGAASDDPLAAAEQLLRVLERHPEELQYEADLSVADVRGASGAEFTEEDRALLERAMQALRVARRRRGGE